MEPFEHPALFYRGREQFLAGTVPFIEAGLAQDEPVLVATLPANLALLRGALGPDAARVELRDMTQAGRNPGRILPSVLLAFAAAHPDRRVRIIGEPIWPGRSPVEYPACAQHEALINVAFAGRDAAILCPYDVTGLDRAVLDDAERTHPVLTGSGRAIRLSPGYRDPVATASTFNLPLPPPPADALATEVELSRLAALRQRVAEFAAGAGLPPERVMDATIAVNELASNTVTHAGTPGTLLAWRESGYLIWQLTDRGHITDPLAGRVPVPPDSLSGRGLLAVNQLCDLVRIHTEPGRTTIRVHFRTTGRSSGSAGEPAGS